MNPCLLHYAHSDKHVRTVYLPTLVSTYPYRMLLILNLLLEMSSSDILCPMDVDDMPTRLLYNNHGALFIL